MSRSSLRTALGAALILCALSWFPSEAPAKVKIVPVPAFSTSKNEGETYGNLTAILFLDEKDEVYAIMAPFLVYNRITGLRGAWQLFGYLEGNRDFVAKTTFAAKINRSLRLEYKDPAFHHGRFTLEAAVLYEKEASYRFFGLTEKSRREDETNYTHRELSARFSFGLHLPKSWHLSWTERFRDVEIQLGGVDELPHIGQLFPEVQGVDGAGVEAHRLTLTHDSRDDPNTPTRGWRFSAYAEMAHAFYGGHVTPYSGYGLEFTSWHPFEDERFILVPSARSGWVSGSGVPFFERSMLGGENTLRAFGTGRFVDDHFLLFNLELRARVLEVTILGIRTEGELTPFVDVGRVFSCYRKDFFRSWQVNPGLGIRMLVRPNIVGRFDMGFGTEGSALFVGLDFPF